MLNKKIIYSALLIASCICTDISYCADIYFAPKAENQVLNHIRKLFYKAVTSEEKTEELDEYLTKNFSVNTKNYTPLILAYSGGITALKAKHAINPFAKLDFLITSLKRLSMAVELDPDNLEIRFLRFSVLDHLPGFLGYGDELNDDKNVIYSKLLKQNYTSLDREIQSGIIEYMLDSKRLSDKQASELNDLIKGNTNNE